MLEEPATLPATSRPWTLALPGGRALLLGGRPRVMGVLNLTPDSFSDGGLFAEPARAVERGLAMLAEGAVLLDLGAESTRPGGGVYGAGAREVPVDEEWSRLQPVLAGLRRATAAPLSVDTRKGEVARRALAAGADLVNDVAAGADPALLAAVAEAGCPLVLMHSRGELATMQRGIHFADPVREVRAELAAAVARAVAAGVAEEQLLVDPGIGFGKTALQNLLLLRRLDDLAELGRPVLVGASRKSFLGTVTGAPPAERLAESLAAAAWGAAGGAAVLRVHDVAATARFLAVWAAIGEAAEPGETAP
ncbi:MAG TPA: dihydropteroate synthase [Thermoanaerobaculia bacterium]|nr:dihydropteroate synthase [Thermoanaerobaculia bacterium]